MAVARSALTREDVSTLVRGASADARAVAAHKVCRRIEAGLAETQRQAADEVLRLMALDAAELVRRALAVTLKASRALPRDVALRLARDVDSVATPVLAASPVLTEGDLAEIVRVSCAIKQMAVARRDALSETVTDALSAYAGEDAVKLACANDNARFGEAALATALDRFAASASFAAAVARRTALPPAIVERLIDRVGDPAGEAADLQSLIAHLRRADRLTPSLLLRALAHGRMGFFEGSLAELAGVAHDRVWDMVHDAGPRGLTAICDRAGLPPALHPGFQVGVDTYHQLQSEGGDFDLKRFQDRMLERFLTAEAADPDQVDDLLARLDWAEPAAVSAVDIGNCAGAGVVIT